MQDAPLDLSRFTAAIFDMDGTMIENMSYHKKAWQEFFRRHGVHLGDDEFQQKISGKKNDEICELVFGRHVHDDELNDYAAEKEALYKELYRGEIKEVDGLTTFVDTLQARGVKTAIATTAPKDNREFVLASLDLNGKFDVILGDEHVTNGKPHPEIYLETARRLGVDPADCVVFEDSPPGVQAGKAAGMSVVGLLTSHVAGELAGADYTIRDFTELMEGIRD